jgi:hypothetical protein
MTDNPIFGGFEWAKPGDRERAFRSTIPTEALARAFGEWYFRYKRSSPTTALTLLTDVYFEILDVRGDAAAEQFLSIADPSDI